MKINSIAIPVSNMRPKPEVPICPAGPKRNFMEMTKAVINDTQDPPICTAGPGRKMMDLAQGTVSPQPDVPICTAGPRRAIEAGIKTVG